MLGGLDTGAVDTLLRHAERGDFLVELRHLVGALSRPGRVPSALGRRDGEFVLYTGGVGEAATVVPDLEHLHTAMRPWSTGGVCVNFLSGADVSATTLASGYLPDDVIRLDRLQRRVDPTGMVRFHHGAR